MNTSSALTETEKAYLAGIVDGEGSISMQDAKWAAGKPLLSIDSTDPELIAWIHAKCGGHVVVKKKYQDHHRQCHTWRMTNRSAIAFLAQLLPYMVIERKRARAELLIEEYESVTPRNGYYTSELRAAKNAFKERFFAIK